MDISSLINYLPPYALHAALLATVVLSATLVFVFSFRNVGEPSFSERKSSSKKKKQPKEKKTQNGHAVTVNQGEKQKPEPKKEVQKSPAKAEKVKQNEAKKEKSNDAAANKKVVKEKAQPKEKKENVKNSPKETKAAKSPGKGKENVDKNKKLLRLAALKPKEENGGWEQAISRKERRARKALIEDLNANLDADGNLQRGREDKGAKKDKDSIKPDVAKITQNEGDSQPDGDVKENAVTVTPAKKNAEPKQKQSVPTDEPPVGSSTVYDDFAEVFKEPSKKAIKKRVRKE